MGLVQGNRGVQLNKVKDFDVDFNPRAGLIFYPFDNVNIKTLYSTAYRAPSINELYLNHDAMRGRWLLVYRKMELRNKSSNRKKSILLMLGKLSRQHRSIRFKWFL